VTLKCSLAVVFQSAVSLRAIKTGRQAPAWSTAAEIQLGAAARYVTFLRVQRYLRHHLHLRGPHRYGCAGARLVGSPSWAVRHVKWWAESFLSQPSAGLVGRCGLRVRASPRTSTSVPLTRGPCGLVVNLGHQPGEVSLLRLTRRGLLFVTLDLAVLQEESGRVYLRIRGRQRRGIR